MGRRASLTVVAALAMILAAGPARGQLDPKAAADTVLAQLEAFRRDDYDTAYTFASEAIRQIFDRQRFERMVQTGYPEIARSHSAVIASAAVTSHGHASLVVKIRGANGHRILAIYEMVWENSGWRIDGVVSRPDDDVV